MTYPKALAVRRLNITLSPDQSRVLLRPFGPPDAERASRIIERILMLEPRIVDRLVAEVSAEFSKRHQRLEQRFLDRYEDVSEFLVCGAAPTSAQKLLIGSYFLAEYSLESAALFNPSIVAHPDQSDMPAGGLRFILSLRATGEGHVSSITFRTGVIHPDSRIEVFAPTGFLTEPTQKPNVFYEKALFERKLSELGLAGEFRNQVLQNLGAVFTLDDLRAVLKTVQLQRPDGITVEDQHASQAIWLLARSNYAVQFEPGQQLCERIIFPATPSQRNGIEDARFVRFRNDDGTYCYYATFTAYDGRIVMPELVETSDFLCFRFITLNGAAARNKGMAMFPRKIDGQYAMLSRQDNESIHLMFSDNVHFWNEHQILIEPTYPWELVQLGNCGSPIETEAGWLVLTHGVGPMRTYSIGAILLDLEDPRKVIGRLRDPLIHPDQSEREGYVPNVVYSCGAVIWNGQLIIPYGMADHATRFAVVPVREVLAAMHRPEST